MGTTARSRLFQGSRRGGDQFRGLGGVGLLQRRRSLARGPRSTTPNRGKGPAHGTPRKSLGRDLGRSHAPGPKRSRVLGLENPSRERGRKAEARVKAAARSGVAAAEDVAAAARSGVAAAERKAGAGKGAEVAKKAGA